MQHEEENNKTLHTVARLATGGTQKCSGNSHNCLQLLETQLVTFYRMGDQGRKRLRLVFQRASWIYVMVHASFSVSTAVLKDMYSSSSGNSSFTTATKSIKG